MLNLHFGQTKLPGALRFNSGRSHYTHAGERHTTTHFIINPLRRVFGISWGSRWFVGFMSFEQQTYDRPKTVEPVEAARAHNPSQGEE